MMRHVALAMLASLGTVLCGVAFGLAFTATFPASALAEHIANFVLVSYVGGVAGRVGQLWARDIIVRASTFERVVGMLIAAGHSPHEARRLARQAQRQIERTSK